MESERIGFAIGVSFTMMDVKKDKGLIPIPLRNVVPTIPKHETEM